jgi:hypothetical protein
MGGDPVTSPVARCSPRPPPAWPALLPYRDASYDAERMP